MKNKIVYITDLPLLDNDAPSLHVTQVCKGLSQVGNDVLLLAPDISHIKAEEYRIKYIPSTKQFITILFQPLVTLYLLYLLVTDKYSAIYVRQSPFLFMPFVIGKLFNVFTIIEVNGTQEEEIRIYEKSLFFKLFLEWNILRFIEKSTYELASKIITVTDGIKHYIVKKYHISENKIFVLSNGVDTETFYPQDTINKRALQYLPKDEETYIGYIGGITKWQGLDYIIKAFHQIRQHHKKTKLVIVGDGDYKKELQKVSKELDLTNDVIFINKITHALVPTYINSFDLCVSYPTKVREGITSPFKIYEYFACGKPVVTSNIQGVGDVFKDVAVIANAEDENDLAKKISQTLADKQTMKQLGQKAKKYVESGNSWFAVSSKINELITNR